MFTLRKGAYSHRPFGIHRWRMGFCPMLTHSRLFISLPKYEGLYSKAGAPRTGTPGRNSLRLPPATRVGRWAGLGLVDRSRRPPASCPLLTQLTALLERLLPFRLLGWGFPLSFPVSLAGLTVLLRLQCVSESPRGLVQTQVAGPYPRRRLGRGLNVHFEQVSRWCSRGLSEGPHSDNHFEELKGSFSKLLVSSYYPFSCIPSLLWFFSSFKIYHFKEFGA